ncbi:DUF3082 domain-containing protein [Pantanalinema rosaneae CENA516]|uniref:DUF3082 domain-containing protein n=1 Tax=Pantanalinema rosaneae TaxID=1620701 RepID=UPI003D6E5E7B
MSDLPQSPESEMPPAKPGMPPLSPWRCWLGAVVAGAIAVVLYLLTMSIVQTFAAKGIHTDSLLVRRITAAVRTLIVGMAALGTGIFGMATIGLFGLGVQLTIQRLKGQPADKPSA